MIRILIRQVIDCRHRASKSLGIGCIEPIAELPLIRGQAAPDYGAHLPCAAARRASTFPDAGAGAAVSAVVSD